jgi:F0F1-type ATP synthase membrane subunit b/b'
MASRHDHPGNLMQIIPDLIPSLVLTLPFLVSMIALHVIFFKPLFAYMEEREGVANTARQEADDFQQATGEKLAQLETELIEARRRAAAVRSDSRTEAQAEEAVIIAAARKKAEGELEEAVTQIAAEAQTAAATLKGTAATLSAEIAQQVLGRPLAS